MVSKAVDKSSSVRDLTSLSIMSLCTFSKADSVGWYNSCRPMEHIHSHTRYTVVQSIAEHRSWMQFVLAVGGGNPTTGN